MRTPRQTNKNRSATLLVPATAMASLLLAVATAFAGETGTAPQQAWGDNAAAKALSASRPVMVNSEEVEILRRLLALTAAAEESAAPVVWETCEISEGFTALDDSQDASSDSRVATADSSLW